MNSKTHIYEAELAVTIQKENINTTLSQVIYDSYTNAISTSSCFTIALSGGSLPSFLSTLPSLHPDIDWTKWHVLLADERIVPFTHQDSNLGSLRNSLLNHVPIPQEQIYGIDESLLSNQNTQSNIEFVNSVAHEYEHRVFQKLSALKDTSSLNNNNGDHASSSHPAKFLIDCVVLGFGPDGHTCSLFPNHSLLDERKMLVAGIADSPKPPPNRITLTFPVLNEMSRDVIFVGAGESKSPILSSIFTDMIQRKVKKTSKYTKFCGSSSDVVSEFVEWYDVKMTDEPIYPCGMVRPTVGKLCWIIDSEAAGGIEMFPSSSMSCL